MDGAAIEKGVAFPVCVSVNDVICNNSPLASQEMVSNGHMSVLYESFQSINMQCNLPFLPHTPSIVINRNHSLQGILLNLILDVISMDI